MIIKGASLLVALVCLTVVSTCAPSVPAPPSLSTRDSATETSAAASSTATRTGSLVIVGRVVTMDERPVAEALLIQDGTVAAVGTRDQVRALADDQVRVVDIGPNVAYPGFIDANAHWIGDREIYALESPAAAMDAALTRGWTSISEQWVDPERLAELGALAVDDAMPLRVDAYLALNFGNAP